MNHLIIKTVITYLPINPVLLPDTTVYYDHMKHKSYILTKIEDLSTWCKKTQDIFDSITKLPEKETEFFYQGTQFFLTNMARTLVTINNFLDPHREQSSSPQLDLLKHYYTQLEVIFCWLLNKHTQLQRLSTKIAHITSVNWYINHHIELTFPTTLIYSAPNDIQD